MIQCRYCGRPCGCHYNDPCVCPDMCPDCDVKPDERLDYDDLDESFDYDDGGEG